jgi:hypothetical protein
MMTHTERERGRGESERERREMGKRKRESIPEERLVFTHRRAYNVRIEALGLVVSLHALCKCVRERARARWQGGVRRDGEQRRESARTRASERASERARERDRRERESENERERGRHLN